MISITVIPEVTRVWGSLILCCPNTDYKTSPDKLSKRKVKQKPRERRMLNPRKCSAVSLGKMSKVMSMEQREKLLQHL